ncbi:Cypemycin N-terminal methyltransferase [Polaribacter huanghezhanensis]|uniref:class I SAM-dependent methyltransferase n=1 Tax=Polaribacter huanghezhanensis TaxID=1354726 RepID=UPI002649CFF6|nr:class I SAM-dependent methyltransferase [Polaribacter huanghezhanensis]WKD86529.1 Cypemycin N-terminal methyltransferase [Polaribacter huanghezhanensis]
MNTKKDWFTSWFDTPFYHTLYKDRDDTEARIFMQNITAFLQLDPETHILDLACGKGRHSVFLNSLGYKVTGADLSENNIKYATSFENERLNFEVHDMRSPIENKYDAIFNLFTSFGYFEDDQEDIKVLENIKKGLKENGIAVIDFLNVVDVKKNLVANEVKSIDGVDFFIHRKIENGFIIKEIKFTADGEEHSYFERVKYLDIEKFIAYFKKAGLKINHIFGNYSLSAYDKETSNRLIFVVS